MPQPVGQPVERRGPAADAALARRWAAWSSFSGMTAAMPRQRSSARLARLLSALSASTREGLVRGRPGPSRGTRMPPNTAANWGLSPRWPAVTTIDSGR
jgi:hypothetical protein